MTEPSEQPDGSADRPVDLGKRPAPGSDPNDPYRFGLPDALPPPEYAPPGWTPPGGWPVAPSSAAPAQQQTGPPPGYPPGYPPPGYPPPGYPPPGYPPPGYPPSGYPPNPAPYPYGWTPPPSPYPTSAPGRGKAVAALVLGLLSIFMFWASILDAVLVVAAVAFGIVAVTERSAGSGSPRGMAIAGLVCAGVGAVLAIIWTVFLFHAINQCGGLQQSGRPGFDTCLQHHLG